MLVGNQIRISGKDLGALAMPDFCHRCFWVKMRCERMLPFQFFPGIFARLDSYQKRLTDRYFTINGRLPPWYGKFGLSGEPIACPHHSSFFLEDREFGIRLTGAPDELLRQPGSELAILDHKTSRHTAGQDEMLMTYVVQLNSYLRIAKARGLGRVVRLGLLYHEPMTDPLPDDIANYVGEESFLMRFEPVFVPVEIDRDMIPPLLRRVRQIFDKASAPPGLEGCRDCGLVDRLVDELLREMHDY